MLLYVWKEATIVSVSHGLTRRASVLYSVRSGRTTTYRRRRYERNAPSQETARHVAPHWPKLHKAEKRCRKAYEPFKAHLAPRRRSRRPGRCGTGWTSSRRRFGWSMPAFAASDVGRRRRRRVGPFILSAIRWILVSVLQAAS